MKILWIDTETTGLDCRKHEVIQLAGIVEVEKKILEAFNFRCRPSSPSVVTVEALNVQGRTLDEVMSWPEPETLWNSFMQTLRQYIDPYNKADKFIPGGQNVGFDVDFLAETARRHKEDYLFSYIHYHKIDTLSMAMIAKLLGRLPTDNLKLETLARHFKLEQADGAHDAWVDVCLTRQVAQKLLRLIAGKEDHN